MTVRLVICDCLWLVVLATGFMFALLSMLCLLVYWCCCSRRFTWLCWVLLCLNSCLGLIGLLCFMVGVYGGLLLICCVIMVLVAGDLFPGGFDCVGCLLIVLFR